jgi:hypothetical protein
MKNRIKTLAAATAFCFTLNSAQASPEGKEINIPLVSDAQVFAEFKEKSPWVVNYFTAQTKEQIQTFYQEYYGPQLAQQVRRGRLELDFEQDGNKIRVIISQQNNARQVDIIIEPPTELPQ